MNFRKERFMKKTYVIKTALLLALTLFQTIPAYASAGAAAPASGTIQPSAGTIVGSIDLFNGTQIHGWAYDTASTKEADELLIKITDTATGETVKEITADPNTQRTDLISRFGDDATPAFSLSIETEDLKDGIYSAAGYQNDQKVTGDAYYVKGSSDTAGESGETAGARSLGTFRLTAYCPCYSCSEGWGRQTSSGKIATANHTVAVDRRVIPIGSRLMINGTIYTAEDVGGGVRGNHVDIYFDNHAQTRQFGSQHAEVFLLQ